jgi:hypothetical protein
MARLGPYAFIKSSFLLSLSLEWQTNVPFLTSKAEIYMSNLQYLWFGTCCLALELIQQWLLYSIITKTITHFLWRCMVLYGNAHFISSNSLLLTWFWKRIKTIQSIIEHRLIPQHLARVLLVITLVTATYSCYRVDLWQIYSGGPFKDSTLI